MNDLFCVSENVTKIERIRPHVIILSKKENIIYGYGNNEYKQIVDSKEKYIDKRFCEILNFKTKIMDVKCGIDFSLFLDEHGEIYFKGNLEHFSFNINENGKILDIPRVKTISCGFYHIALIDYNNNLWTDGDNRYGQVYDKLSEQDIKSSLKIILKECESVSCGSFHTMAVDSNHKLFGWGNNDFFQLSDHHRTNLNEIDVGFPVKNIFCCFKYSIIEDFENYFYILGCIHGYLNPKVKKIGTKKYTHIELFLDSFFSVACDNSIYIYNINCKRGDFSIGAFKEFEFIENRIKSMDYLKISGVGLTDIGINGSSKYCKIYKNIERCYRTNRK